MTVEESILCLSVQYITNDLNEQEEEQFIESVSLKQSYLTLLDDVYKLYGFQSLDDSIIFNSKNAFAKLNLI